MEDIPVGVRDTLCQVLAEAHKTEERETALALLDTARRVATNKLAEGDRQDRLLHGCERATTAFDAGNRELARAYIAAMERRLCGND